MPLNVPGGNRTSRRADNGRKKDAVAGCTGIVTMVRLFALSKSSRRSHSLSLYLSLSLSLRKLSRARMCARCEVRNDLRKSPTTRTAGQEGYRGCAGGTIHHTAETSRHIAGSDVTLEISTNNLYADVRARVLQGYLSVITN